MRRYWVAVWIIVLLTGCQSTHEQLINQGYPPAYADGFEDGCSSGRQAAGVMAGDFRKDVPRYLHNPQYETGWDDGLRQCQAMQENQDLQDYRAHHWDERDEQWQQEKDRDAARAYRRK
ncbi:MULTISPECIES: hypothetical protein [Pseudomonas]|uniref:Lipoprotein n=1 Tax=Pseudomonas sp. Hg7Tf TaxID=3236988 RepID=A0AB39HZX2_9PSED|nr:MULTISPECIES: hypothetical protein [Pseudomonas]KJK05958.1 lipoprotein [Pseudomonas sp. 5]MDD1978303.1 hypothetical protein [Pseudomonas putida]MDH2559979.1 hypothetical protein [Pseudomonas sp. Hg5Tf]